jgi:hypothetical protein
VKAESNIHWRQGSQYAHCSIVGEKSETLPTRGAQFLVYRTEDGKLKIDVRVQCETVWLSLNQLAELFLRDKSVISRHIKNVFEEGELSPEGTVAKSATIQTRC